MLHCDAALDLLGPYMDGELAESQAAPLRRHLLECPGCRLGARREKSLKLWFARAADAEAAGTVPTGFAARVARAAFERGRVGDPVADPQVANPIDPSIATPNPFRGAPVDRPAARADARALRFAMALTAAAAGLLLVLSGVLRSHAVPHGESLRAQEASELLEQADALNALELRADERRVAPEPPARRVGGAEHRPPGELGTGER
jgi:hypothetical protein